MYTDREISTELLAPWELPQEDCVTIFLSIAADRTTHSGLVISFQNKLYAIHFDGRDVLFNESIQKPKPAPVLKRLKQIKQAEVEAFLSFCHQISKVAKPKYGYFYSGSFYNTKGELISLAGTEEFMTCVGFCISVISGYMQKDYISFLDWNEATMPGFSEYLTKFIEKVNSNRTIDKVDADKFKKHVRRITPMELTTSGFHEKIPISKEDIDSNVVVVTRCVIEKAKTIE